VQMLTSQLQASRVNWNNRPTVGGQIITTRAGAGGDNTLVELDVTPFMQQVADGAAWHGVRITIDRDLRYVTSSDGPSHQRPQLYVAWSEAPHAPTSLSPNGQVVTVAKPVVRFQVFDNLGDTTLAGGHVQADFNNTDFVDALWDSGWVPIGSAQVDLAATSFPGLADGQGMYWRVQVQDGAGLVSPWSDIAFTARQPKGTVTINNPPAATPVVSDPTPPILWSFAPGVQAQWQVYVVNPADPSRVLANSGVRTGGEVAWTLPEGVVVNQADTYRVFVRVWDNVPRDPTDAYSESYRDFTYVDDPNVGAVTALQMNQPNPWPGMFISWQRATVPDSFVIERDGHVVVPDLLPQDCYVGGTSYRYVDPQAKCWQGHTWQVKAKVNGRVSESATLTAIPTLRGIWLMDESRGLHVWIAGADGGTWTRPEDASVIAPIGSRKVIRRVQGMRNYEGSLSGQLVDGYGRTALQYQDDLEVIRNRPELPVVLAVADYSLRVVLGNINFAPTLHIPPSRLVSFDFWEV
jgi:hypothetical protein